MNRIAMIQPVYGAETWSRGRDILVNHTTDTIATLDASFAPFRRRRERWACRVGRSEGQRSMRSVDVVMIDEDSEDPASGARDLD
jgi:hypothetical protein